MKESRPLYIWIHPFGVFPQFCTLCGCKKFGLVEDNKFWACGKCGAKIAEWDAEQTAKVENTKDCDGCTKH